MGVVAGLVVIAASLVLSSGAPAAPSADWKWIEFVFTGSGRSDYLYPPDRVGKSQSFTMKWRIEWRLKPNQGYPKTVKETVSGHSDYKRGTSGTDCSGDIAQYGKNLAPVLPTGNAGRKTLLGAAVPMFQNLAHVPNCAGTPGDGLATAYYGSPAYWKHKLNVAEVALDYANPKSVTLRYKPGWKGKGPQGDSDFLSWSGQLAVTVVK
jgi:hypothetical protein